MEPNLESGQLVVASSLYRRLRVGDVVVIVHNRLEKIKRVEKQDNGKIYVLGDNPYASTDSRTFGWIDRHDVLGKVVWPR